MNVFKGIDIRDILAVLVSLMIFVMVFFKDSVPDQIWSGWMVILTFFFTKPSNNGNGTTTQTTEVTK